MLVDSPSRRHYISQKRAPMTPCTEPIESVCFVSDQVILGRDLLPCWTDSYVLLRPRCMNFNGLEEDDITRREKLCCCFLFCFNICSRSTSGVVLAMSFSCSSPPRCLLSPPSPFPSPLSARFYQLQAAERCVFEFVVSWVASQNENLDEG